MKLKSPLYTILSLLSPFFCLLFLLSFSNKTKANTLFPHTNELLITNEETRTGIVSFINETNKTVYINPVIYSFDPQTTELIEGNKENLFIKTNNEYYPVKEGETLELEYQVLPFKNMAPGTYFNLIVLQRQTEDTFVTQTNPVGAIESLSHLVVMHITDPDNDVRGITTEFAEIDIKIVKKGIPFIIPSIIKYTYENTTNYVLKPMGEIQVYSEKGNYSPQYIKINQEEEKLYPGGVMEEEFPVSFHLSDLYSKKVIVGRFYNGIDENLIIKEATIDPNYINFVGLALIITLVAISVKIIKSRKNKQKVKKNSE